ncbi:RagB/SusD family nutrient uptake outer membrane protein [Nibribacter ruber]|uniref:RagB/SusD family nutrient uptake outer membrane protein n=1 Tax=Nibribacter ruber TaxID=2698458 RepID=A0A6P1P2N9_9BACT|nr:RagB/SusD family nutrient uptake outer membrane protein [Nibribacter ruber]QHL88650.1 RagB/SusD family nutrient uptake outer membrane protein [Nibribacter ruber]
MLKKYMVAVLMGATVLSVSSCDDLLDTAPKQSISLETGLENITGIRALLIGVYDRMQVNTYYGAQMMLAPDVMADNLRQTSSNSNRYTGFQSNTFGTQLNRWAGNYGAINDVNLILGALGNITDPAVTAAEKARIGAEAKFLRALFYHDLLRTYSYEPGKEVGGFNAGVVLRLEPVDTKDEADFMARATNVQVYAQIEKDLTEAIAGFTTSNQTSWYRANKAAAEALMARVSLYQSKWQQALDYSNTAIATAAARGKGLVAAANYAAAWTTLPNPESLFELNYVQATETLGANESLNSLTTNVFTGAWADIVPTNTLFNLYEVNDVRRAMYYTATKSGEAVRFNRKFAGNQGVFTDNIPLIRLSEVHLIKAEAEAELAAGDEVSVAGLATLNGLRAKRDASPVVALTKTALINAILVERRMELVYEGHRFFDLKRRGLDIAKDPQVAAAAIPYTDPRVLAPIPADQVALNPKLVKNPGY